MDGSTTSAMSLLESWDERAAIMEFCGGMTRFQAETRAAQDLGTTRWSMIDEKRKRDFGEAPNRGAAGKWNNAD